MMIIILEMMVDHSKEMVLCKSVSTGQGKSEKMADECLWTVLWSINE